MQATFKFELVFDNDDIAVDMVWVERQERRRIPFAYLPRSWRKTKELAMAVFPRYRWQLGGVKVREKRRKKRIDAHFKKLVPQQEKFQISSASGKTYEITVIDRGKGRNIHCTCPDYLFRQKKRGAYCKHIAEWLKEKQHPVSDEIAIVDSAPSMHTIPSIEMKLKQTLRGMDCDEFLEEKFEKQIADGTRRKTLLKNLVRR